MAGRRLFLCHAAMALCGPAAARLQATRSLPDVLRRGGLANSAAPPQAADAALGSAPFSNLQAPFYYTAQLFRIGLPDNAPAPTAPLALGVMAPSTNVIVPVDYSQTTVRCHSGPLSPPAWTPAWTAYAPVDGSLPWEPMGYTAMIEWLYPEVPSAIVAFTVDKATGDVWLTTGGQWEYAGAGPWADDGPTPEGQLVSVFIGHSCPLSPLCDQLIFWPGRGNAAWLLHGGQTDPNEMYTWQPITLPGDPNGTFAVSVNSCPSKALPGANYSISMWAYTVHATSPDDGLLHLYLLQNDTLVGSSPDAWIDQGPVTLPAPLSDPSSANRTRFWSTYAHVLDISDDPPFPYGFFFMASDGTNIAYSFSGGRDFSISNDTAAAESGAEPVLALGPSALPGGPRNGLHVPLGLSPGYWHNTDTAGVVLGGGTNASSGAPLSDVWVSQLRMTCRGNFTQPPDCTTPCPNCGHGVCAHWAVESAPCICSPGWDVATNCTACLPGVACNPAPPAAVTGLSVRDIGLIAGGAAAGAAVLVGAAFGLTRLRRRIRAARGAAEYDVFVSYDWGQGGARAEAITTRLRAGGLRVWRDKEDMRQHMLISMVSGVQTARAAVLIVTRNYVRSANCRLEAEQVLVRARTEGLPFLLVRPGGSSSSASSVGGSDRSVGGGSDRSVGSGRSVGSTGGSGRRAAAAPAAPSVAEDEVDLDTLPDSHPVVRLALLAPHAVVRFNDTFGDEAWCRYMIDALADGSAAAAATTGTAAAASASASPASPSSGAAVDAAAASGAAANAGLRAVVSSIFQRAAAPISLVYFEEHDAIMRPLRAGLEASGWRVNIWAHPKASAQQLELPPHLRPMVPALRRASVVILVLGHDFARRCPRALQEAYARNGADKANVYVVAEAGYEPQSTARCHPTEDAVAAVVGASIYVRVVGTAERDADAWAGHLATIRKQITDKTPLRPVVTAVAAAAPGPAAITAGAATAAASGAGVGAHLLQTAVAVTIPAASSSSSPSSLARSPSPSGSPSASRTPSLSAATVLSPTSSSASFTALQISSALGGDLDAPSRSSSGGKRTSVHANPLRRASGSRARDWR